MENDPLAAQVAALTTRVYALEILLRGRGLAAPEPEPPPTPVVRPRVTQPTATPPLVMPASVGRAPEVLAPELSLEARVGTHWFQLIGALAFLMGFAWFLKYAMDAGWMGPRARVLAGLAIGLGLLAASERYWRRATPVASYTLMALGNGVIYLALWASFRLYGLVPSPVAFLGMGAVIIWNGVRSWRANSPTYAGYALLCGFLIPLLLGSGGNHEAQLFAYLLLLDLAVAAIVALRPWFWMLPAAFGATVALAAGWSWRYWTPRLWLGTDGWVLALLLLFALATAFSFVLRTPEADDSVDFAGPAAAFPTLVASIGFLALCVTQDSPDLAHWQAGSALLLASLSFALLLVLGPTSAELDSNPPHEGHRLFRLGQLALALSFVSLAILLKFHDRKLTLIWLAEGLGLMLAARNWPRLLALRYFALGIFAAAALGCVAANQYAGGTVFLNPRFGVYLLCNAGVAAGAGIAVRQSRLNPYDSGVADTRLIAWRPLGYALGLLASLLLWWGVMAEITTWWEGAQQPFSLGPTVAQAIGCQFTYSAWCVLFGAILLGGGVWKRLPPLRWEGLAFLLLAVAKIFFFDINALSQGFRVVSFLGLGAMLIAISLAYQHNWLGLRATAADAEASPKAEY